MPDILKTRLPALDLARFVAAVAVVVYHYTYRPFTRGIVDEHLFGTFQQFSKFGYLGVSLFFLISGFVILWTASGRTPQQFVLSRALRLYPTFWVSVLATLAFIVWLRPDPTLTNSRAVIANLSMLPGLVDAPMIDSVYWTLFVEMKFYLLVFILLVTRQLGSVEVWLTWWLSCFTISVFVPGIPALRSLVIFPYGSLFIGGCVFYLGFLRGWSPWRYTLLTWAICISCIEATSLTAGFVHDPAPRDRIVALLGTALCFAIVALATSALCKNIQSRVFVWLGSLTYALYLLHNRISKLLWTAGEDYLSGPWRLVGISLVALMLAWLISGPIDARVTGWLRNLAPVRRLMSPGAKPAHG